MKSSIIAILACFFLCLNETVAYSALLLPLPRHAPTPTTTTITQAVVDINTALRDGEFVMKGVWQRLRGKNRVQTLERESTQTKTKKKKDPERLWRVMFHNSDYHLESVARVLAQVIPAHDRRSAYALCQRARTEGKVVVIITRKQDAEICCLAINRQGLTATVEPHIVDE